MNYWIGVIGSSFSFKRFLNNDFWFCMPPAASVGDIVVMYVSRKGSEVKAGVFAFYKIKLKDETKHDKCRQYGSLSGAGEKLTYVEFDLIKNLDKSITFQDIKNEPRFINTLYVRRQMQATYFKISNSEYETFVNLSNKINDNK
jgi:predicted RNA-binding protein with PUA-like domain